MTPHVQGHHDRPSESRDRSGSLTTWVALALIVVCLLLVVLVLSLTPDVRGDDVPRTITEEPVSE